MQLETLFTEMADALRTKEETTDKISAESFPQRIKDLKVLDTTDATATANDIVAGKIAYANGKRVIGTVIENGKLEYTPSHEEQIIPAGKTSGGIVKAINSEEVIINPTTEEQIKEGLFNKVKVEGIKTQDLMIIPKTEEQKFTGLFKNVTVEPADGGLDTSDATATAEDILLGKTAYVNGEKVIGELEIKGNDSDNNTIIGPQITSTSGASASGYCEELAKNIIKISDIIIVNSGTGIFKNCTKLEEVNNIDCTKATKINYMFCNCSKLKKVTIETSSKINDYSRAFDGCKSLITVHSIDMSNSIGAEYMFNNCSSITEAPEMDTSNVIYIRYMFYGCSSLVDVPVYNAGSVTGSYMQNMFGMCPSLSDESLNNILATCSSAVKLTANKTLAYIGLTQEQATRCQSLSNYQAFLDAGWTTGY